MFILYISYTAFCDLIYVFTNLHNVYITLTFYNAFFRKNKQTNNKNVENFHVYL